MWVPWAEGGLAFWVVGDNGDVVVWVVSLTPGGHAADVASGKVSAGADMGGSGGAVVLVDDPPEDVSADDVLVGEWYFLAGDRLCQLQSAMGPGSVVVGYVVGEHRFEVSA